MQIENRFPFDNEIERVHQQSLQILSEVGIKTSGSVCLELLRRKGAVVDGESHIARLPESLVQTVLASAPKTFTLGAREPSFDFPLPSPFSGYTLDAAATFFQDFSSGERRLARLEDNHNALRVFDAMDLGSIVWPPVQLSDVPPPNAPSSRASSPP